MDSSWGSNTTLVAPAEELVSPDRTAASGYSFFNGTSAATAQVSASAALVRAEHPDLTAGQVVNRLIKTAKPLTDAKGNAPKLPDEKFGYGVVRPFRAVTYDVPAGPESGPLEQPETEASESAAPATSSSSDDGTGWMFMFGPPIVLFTVVFLLLVVLAVLLIVLWSRSGKKKAARQAPVGAGWGAPAPPQAGPPPGPYGAPYGQAPPLYQGVPQPGPGQFGQVQPPPANGPVPPPPQGR